MTDRELLEMAAKAAGHRIVEWAADGNGVEVAIIVRSDGDGFSKRPWQPMHENQMTDCDGDALRLAVALRMQIDILERSIYAVAIGGTKVCELDRADIAAATRRAITRAAAEIGKGMP